MNKFIKFVLMLLIVVGCNGQNSQKSNSFHSNEKKAQNERKGHMKYPKNYVLEIGSSGQTDSTYILSFSYARTKPDFPVNFNSGFMIHKNGTKWWFNYAQEKYKEIVFGENYGYSNARKHLMSKDSVLLKDFDKWMFTIDKKYIQEYPPIADGDNPETWDYPNYDLKENSDFEAKLFRQKNNTEHWVEIEKRVFKNGSNNEIEAYHDWINKFKEEKLEEDIKKNH